MNICLPFREDYPVTQGFGGNADAYAKFGLKGHNGIDYGLPNGTTVVACDDGTIVRIADDPTGYGHYVKIQHSWGESIYAHLQTSLVANNFPVKKGQAIGYSDNTGNSTGPHLHFGIRIYPYNSNDGYSGYSDPTPYISGHFIPDPSQGGTETVNIRDKFKIIFSVLHSKPEDLVTEADIDQAVGSALDPYNYGTQDLNNRIIQPILDQVTALTNRVKELENAQNQPTPEPTTPNPISEPPDTGSQGTPDLSQPNSGENTTHDGNGNNGLSMWNTLFPTISAILNWLKKQTRYLRGWLKF